MKLTILGYNGPYPSKESSCSSYLLETENKKVLLDIGNGSLSALQKVTDLDKIDAIILSHLHPDHISDLFVYRYYLESIGKSIPVYTPHFPENEFRRLPYQGLYELHALSTDLTLNIDSVKFSFSKNVHPFECFAIKMEENNKTIVYGADSAYNKDLEIFIKNADYALLDSAFISGKNEDKLHIHMNAMQCAEMAKSAGVKNLILTHLNPFTKKEDYLKDASKVKGIKTDIASALKEIEV